MPILDLRTPQDYMISHIANAISVPSPISEYIVKRSLRDQLVWTLRHYAPSKYTPILLYCYTGQTAKQASTIIKNLGFVNVKVLGSYNQAQNLIKNQVSK